MKSVFLAIIFLSVLVVLMRVFKDRVRKWALFLSAKLQLKTLRDAIHKADANKEKTGRKNIVVFNTDSRSFEPAQKKQMKQVAKFGKNTSNRSKVVTRRKISGGKITVTRRKIEVNKKSRPLTLDRIKHIEEKSLYKTA